MSTSVPDLGKFWKKRKETLMIANLREGKYHSAVPTINIYFVSYDNKRKILWIGRTCLPK